MYKNIDTDTAGVALWEVGCFCFVFFKFQDNAQVNFFLFFFNSLELYCTTTPATITKHWCKNLHEELGKGKDLFFFFFNKAKEEVIVDQASRRTGKTNVYMRERSFYRICRGRP